MPDFVKSLNNVPDSYSGPYDPQQMYIATGNERHLRHFTIEADELCQCEDGSGSGGADNTAPVAVSYFPRVNDPVSGNPPALSSARICFSEIVRKGSGTISLVGPLGTLKTWDIASSPELHLIFGGQCLLIEGIPQLQQDSQYEFQLSSGLVQDLAGNNFVPASAWTFYTPDLLPPGYTFFYPGGSSVDPAVNQLVVQLDEVIQAGVGTLDLYEDGVVIKTWTMGSGIDYTISGNQITLTGFSLSPDAAYMIDAVAGWVRDLGGNSAPAIEIPDGWTFQTAGVATGQFSNDFSDDFA